MKFIVFQQGLQLQRNSKRIELPRDNSYSKYSEVYSNQIEILSRIFSNLTIK